MGITFVGIVQVGLTSLDLLRTVRNHVLSINPMKSICYLSLFYFTLDNERKTHPSLSIASFRKREFSELVSKKKTNSVSSGKRKKEGGTIRLVIILIYCLLLPLHLLCSPRLRRGKGRQNATSTRDVNTRHYTTSARQDMSQKQNKKEGSVF